MLIVLERARLGKETSMQRTGSILVIDDDAAFADLVVEILTDEGYVAYAALSGVDALASITCHTPALLLLDLHMPGMSGVELIIKLRRANLATMPMVLITASPREATPLLVPGAIVCLAKPFDLDDLLASVARFVQLLDAVEAVRELLDDEHLRFERGDVSGAPADLADGHVLGLRR
jgi:two-component system, response regulator, stage 0 sporulation protein F